MLTGLSVQRVVVARPLSVFAFGVRPLSVFPFGVCSFGVRPIFEANAGILSGKIAPAASRRWAVDNSLRFATIFPAGATSSASLKEEPKK